MTWMLTTTAAVVDLRCTRLDSIRILDIAHALSLCNRYHGHTSRPYSVAQHSLLVADIMERDLRVHQPLALLAGLLHDAHEAYTGDLSTPMKQIIGSAWRVEENRIAAHVHARFGVGLASSAWAGVIKQADLMALALERRDLLPDTGPAWPLLQGITLPECAHISGTEGMEWQDWRQAFLDRFAEVNVAVQHKQGAAA